MKLHAIIHSDKLTVADVKVLLAKQEIIPYVYSNILHYWVITDKTDIFKVLEHMELTKELNVTFDKQNNALIF